MFSGHIHVHQYLSKSKCLFRIFIDAILSFTADTPLTMGSKKLDAICMLLIIIPLASLSDFSLIAKVSAVGTSIILSIFLLIAFYGIQENGILGFSCISEQNYWPSDFSSFSSWYGVVACKYLISSCVHYAFIYFFTHN